MKKILTLLSIIILFGACQQNEDVKAELALVRTQLADQTAELQQAKMALEGRKDVLVHSVYFQFKEGITDQQKQEFEQALKGLKEIEYLHNLQVGAYTDTKDKRLGKYDYALQMEFNSVGDLAKYQQDSIHLKVRERVGRTLSGPPVVYDFMAK